MTSQKKSRTQNRREKSKLNGARDWPQLQNEVSEYFSKRAYGGFTKPFVLDHISHNSSNINIVEAIPANLDYEEIMKKDRRWEDGLADIGEKFGVFIRLPYDVYSK